MLCVQRAHPSILGRRAVKFNCSTHSLARRCKTCLDQASAPAGRSIDLQVDSQALLAHQYCEQPPLLAARNEAAGSCSTSAPDMYPYSAPSTPTGGQSVLELASSSTSSSGTHCIEVCCQEGDELCRRAGDEVVGHTLQPRLTKARPRVLLPGGQLWSAYRG